MLFAAKTWWREGLPGGWDGQRMLRLPATSAAQPPSVCCPALMLRRVPNLLARFPAIGKTWGDLTRRSSPAAPARPACCPRCSCAGLALHASTYPLLLAALAALAKHKRAIYMRFRELFFLATVCHLQHVVRLTALHGGVNTIDHHQGPLSLLLLLAGHTTALYV